MEIVAFVVIVGLIAYAIGSINFSVILSKKMAGFDVREKGSGNAGTTNMLRSVGKKAAIFTLILDVLKGVVALLVAKILGLSFQNPALLIQISGIAVVIGHTFPIFFEFKGGKGVATSLGVLLMTNLKVGLICLIFALVIMAITRMVSVGSIGAAVLFPILVLCVQIGWMGSNSEFIVTEGSGYFIYSVLLALLVIFNHRSNIKRLMNGTENKLSFKKKEEAK